MKRNVSSSEKQENAVSVFPLSQNVYEMFICLCVFHHHVNSTIKFHSK